MLRIEDAIKPKGYRTLDQKRLSTVSVLTLNFHEYFRRKADDFDGSKRHSELPRHDSSSEKAFQTAKKALKERDREWDRVLGREWDRVSSAEACVLQMCIDVEQCKLTELKLNKSCINTKMLEKMTEKKCESHL